MCIKPSEIDHVQRENDLLLKLEESIDNLLNQCYCPSGFLGPKSCSTMVWKSSVVQNGILNFVRLEKIQELVKKYEGSGWVVTGNHNESIDYKVVNTELDINLTFSLK